MTARPGDPTGADLVERTAAGDALLLRPAVGVPAVDPGSARPLLVVAARDAGRRCGRCSARCGPPGTAGR
ncbi:hypothetical protein AB0H83_20970 [Dactylosporangium sp. NPDC050688]|uniref:hypothetical protein n=1 Tax=Dactylosporangium sp. NPDC050688 TaxID=3157217 RepID=UPI0034015ECA